MRFEFFIAARYLRAKRRQAVVGVITVISIAGVAAGVASLIIALAITNGMRRDLQDRLLGSTAHVELMRTAGRRHPRLASAAERLRHLPHVTAAAPGLYEEVLIARGCAIGRGDAEGDYSDGRANGERLLYVKQGSAGSDCGVYRRRTYSVDVAGEATPPIVIGSGPGEDARCEGGVDSDGDQSAGGTVSAMACCRSCRDFVLWGFFIRAFINTTRAMVSSG